MAATLALTLALGACAQTGGAPAGPGVVAPKTGPLRVGGQYQMFEGAAARAEAEGICASRGQKLRPSIYDRFDRGMWVYQQGCA